MAEEADERTGPEGPGQEAGAGGAPSSPADLKAESWQETIKRVFKEFQNDNVTDWAAALTYYSVLSVFPGLLVLIALLIAAPIAWWMSNRWLEDFAYRIQLQWWQIALVGLLGLAIALITVSYHSLRAATANPTENARTPTVPPSMR